MLLLLLSSFLPLACSPDTAMRDKKPLAAAKEGDILWHRFAGWNVESTPAVDKNGNVYSSNDWQSIL